MIEKKSYPPASHRIKRALLSVFDKTDLIEIVECLVAYRVDLVATGSTADFIKTHGFSCRDVSEVTGFPEILDGRVKTLHPKIHAGILAKAEDATHRNTLATQEIEFFDLIVAGLYPFEDTLQQTDSPDTDKIEMIDIGGPTMIRAGAKNYASVCVITKKEQYDMFLQEITQENGATTLAFRKRMAQQAFSRTASYDRIISLWMHRDEEYPLLSLDSLEKENLQALSYGENPHQTAQLYKTKPQTRSAAHARFLQGEKELSYNNYMDADFAFSVVSAFERPAVSVIKHKITCGFSCTDDGTSAIKKALDSDRISAFGGVIAANVTFTYPMALTLDDLFVEVLIAPQFDDDAIHHLEHKKNLRILATDGLTNLTKRSHHIRQICDGFLMQTANCTFPNRQQMKTETTTTSPPTNQQWQDLEIAVKLVSFANSNAVVLVQDGQLIGLGSGQTSRARACEIAIKNAEQYHSNRMNKAVGASDGFFPFYDGIETLQKKGLRIIAHPGGSKNDHRILERANKDGVTIITHGIRSFAH